MVLFLSITLPSTDCFHPLMMPSPLTSTYPPPEVSDETQAQHPVRAFPPPVLSTDIQAELPALAPSPISGSPFTEAEVFNETRAEARMDRDTAEEGLPLGPQPVSNETTLVPVPYDPSITLDINNYKSRLLNTCEHNLRGSFCTSRECQQRWLPICREFVHKRCSPNFIIAVFHTLSRLVERS